jgi:hypothetical protein
MTQAPLLNVPASEIENLSPSEAASSTAPKGMSLGWEPEAWRREIWLMVAGGWCGMKEMKINLNAQQN